MSMAAAMIAFFFLLVIVGGGIAIAMYIQSNEGRTLTLDSIMGAATSAPNAPAPIDCVLSGWEDSQACTSEGNKRQTRSVTTQASNGGAACGPLSRIANCDAPVDCALSSWANSGECKSSKQKQTRGIEVEPANGGLKCGATTREIDCVVPTNCKWGPWSVWSSCKNKTKTRTRTVSVQAKDGGAACNGGSKETTDCQEAATCTYGGWTSGACGADGKMQETRVLSQGTTDRCTEPLTRTSDCKVDCLYSDWADSGMCDAYGKQAQTRTITRAAKNGGVACNNNALTQQRDCDCTYSGWVADGTCDSNGQLLETRTLTGGSASRCTEPLTRMMDCKVDCGYSNWMFFGNCDNDGMQVYKRDILYPGKNGGIPCDAKSTTQKKPCECKFDEWYGKGDCTEAGQLYTRRALSGTCGTQTKTLPCKQDCEYTEWFPTGCGQGQTKGNMVRSVWKEAVGGGARCNGETTKPYDCPVDCAVSEWKSGTCVKGVATDTRTIKTQPKFGGKACPELSRTSPCNANCQLSDWYDIDYYESMEIGCGIKRHVIQHGQGTGKKCPAEGSQGVDGLLQLRQCVVDDRPG